MSSAERFRPITWLRNSAASAGVKRKSAARSSVNWPRARNRARGSCGILTGGDDQVHLRRQVLEQKGEGMVNRFGINHVVVVQDEDEIVRDGGDFIEQGRQNRFGWRWLRRLEQHPTPLLQYSAQSSAKQRRGRSESVWGRYPLRPATARPTGRSQPATHSLTSVVLPKPAGAEMRVSLRCRPSFSRSIRRGGGQF